MAAFAVSLILLLVGVAGLASAGTVVAGASSTARPSDAVTPGDLLAQARASAASGEGPGMVPAPAALPHPSAGPNVSFGVAMTYDAADGYVLAVSLNATFGVNNSTYGPSEITWKFTHGNWSVIPTSGSVPATLSPGMVYDARDGYVVLYGGYLMATIPAPVTNQTWSYRGGTWSNLTATSSAPTAVDFSNLVFDASDNYVLLDDELGLSGSPNGTLWTTWSFANGTWSNLTTTAGPAPPSFFGGMTYDVRDQYVVYFGGETLADQLTNATWTFHSGAWSNISGNVTNAPGGRLGFGTTYDSSRQAVLLYGGLVQLYVANWSEYGGDTWEYANGTWTQIASNGTVYNPQAWNTPSMNMVYDPADNETVLFGANISQSSGTAVTWTFSSNTWTVAAPVFASAALTTDVGRAVTFDVTRSVNSGGLSYAYAGLPPGCAPANSADLRCVPTVPGSYRVVVTITGAGGYDVTARTDVTVNPAPSIVRLETSASAGEVGVPIGFTITAANGTGALSYAYSGLPSACSTTNASHLDCVPTAAGNYSVVGTVTDSLGVTAATETHLAVVPALMVADFGAARSVVDVGQALSVATDLAGGYGPFQFAYAGLPTGCSSENGPSVTCHPDTPGAYPIGVAASDVLGGAATGSAKVVVNAWPTVASVVPSSPSVPLGGSVQITTSVLGGTAPFEYAYSGLPAGCTGTGATIACSANSAGPYSVTVTVIDATGASASGSTSFSVGSALPHGPTGGSNSFEGVWGGTSFWWGLAVGGIAILAAGVVGAIRARSARQGQNIVRDPAPRSASRQSPVRPPRETNASRSSRERVVGPGAAPLSSDRVGSGADRTNRSG